PDVRTDAALEHFVAREPRLLLGRDGVDVVGRDHRGHADASLTRALHESRQQIARTRASADVDDGVEGIEPLARLLRIDVGTLVHEAVDEHRYQAMTPCGYCAVTRLSFPRSLARLAPSLRATTGEARTRPETFTKSSAEICRRRRYMQHMADDRAAIAH